jgi:hypothetical protein
MVTSFRVLAGASLLAASLGLVLHAADNAPPTKGKVLVLDNERTLEGDIERQGDQYRIRRSVGETWVAAEKVICLCATKEEAYVCLRGRANLDDPDERLRLAQWCHLQGLRDEALAEVTTAASLRPGHVETKRLLRSLERSAVAAPTKPAGEKKDAAAPAGPPIELTNDSLSLFITKVQPVLMNACASCHASGKAPTFKLVKAFDGANRKTVQANLAAVLAQVSPENGELSPLLIKAVSVHGDMVQPALKGRKSPPYQLLENWVHVTLANNPQLRGRAAAPGAAEESEAKQPAAAFAEKAAAKDAFDPAGFNRQMHPEKK